MARGRDLFQRFSWLLSLLSQIIGLLPMRARSYLLVFFRDTKGLKGLGIRYILVKSLAARCGENVSVHPGVYLFHCEKMSFGSNVSIHPMCYIDGYGGLTVGDDVSIAHSVSILSFDHCYADPSAKIKDQGLIEKPIAVCGNVWIGAKVTILGGVTVGEGSILAAGCVVNKKVGCNEIVAGVPARCVKSRI